MRRSRCTPPGRYGASRPCRSRARRASDGCSRQGRPRRRSCPSFQCTARRSRRPCAEWWHRLPTAVLLLTGATGILGHAVVRRLTTSGTPVRCLVRDPRRLGPERVRVQLAIGDLADPASWRNALRGGDTVVHRAGGARDQPRATVEELNGLAAWRLLRAAERVGAGHFVWITPLGATPHHPMRMQRAKALAAAAIGEADIPTTTLAHSLIYAPGDRHLRWIERLGYLPAVPLVRPGVAPTQPPWGAEAAAFVAAA